MVKPHPENLFYGLTGAQNFGTRFHVIVISATATPKVDSTQDNFLTVYTAGLTSDGHIFCCKCIKNISLFSEK